MIGRQWRLGTVSFLEASFAEKLIFWCCLGGVSVVVSNFDLYNGTFVFL
jgi:hypothetical protein